MLRDVYSQSEVEKTFTNSLIQMSQSIHEQELIAKGNELRRVGSFLRFRF